MAIGLGVHGVVGIGQGLAEPDLALVMRIEMSEYAFTPAQITLRAGKPVTLNVINVGRAPHMFASAYLASQDLEVEGTDLEVDAPKGVKYVKVQPGKSAEIKFRPTQEGTFDSFWDVKSGDCPHRDLGMKGRLVVN
jgi:plastocyanin